MIFSKSKIRNSFAKASFNYDQNADLQKIVAKKTVEIGEKYLTEAQNIIDLGSGTGLIIDNIVTNDDVKNKQITALDLSQEMLDIARQKHQNNTANITYINEDINNIKARSEKFDLAFSSLTFHWLNNLNQSLSKISKIIKKDGRLIFSIIGNDSLHQLKNSCKTLDINLAINDFVTFEELQKSIPSELLIEKIQSENIDLEYDDLFAILHSIKNIGGNHSPKSKILTKAKFNTINDFYLKNFKKQNKVIASWNVFFIICKIN